MENSKILWIIYRILQQEAKMVPLERCILEFFPFEMTVMQSCILKMNKKITADLYNKIIDQEEKE